MTTNEKLDSARIAEILAGKFSPASRFFFMPGMAPPGGGPDAILMKATSQLKVVYEVTTGAERFRQAEFTNRFSHCLSGSPGKPATPLEPEL